MIIKIHVGCGTVYLKDYINCDIKGSRVHYAYERPDLVSQYETTEDKYYARHEASDISRFRAGPKEAQSVCDVDCSFEQLPFPDNFADEILSRQVWEHMSLTEAKKARNECNRVLKPGGLLRIDVPDIQETLSKLVETGDPFYARHFLGPQSKGSHGYHVTGYTAEALKNSITELSLTHGGFGKEIILAPRFKFVKEEPNIHCYPAICLTFMKVE